MVSSTSCMHTTWHNKMKFEQHFFTEFLELNIDKVNKNRQKVSQITTQKSRQSQTWTNVGTNRRTHINTQIVDSWWIVPDKAMQYLSNRWDAWFLTYCFWKNGFVSVSVIGECSLISSLLDTVAKQHMLVTYIHVMV